MLDYLSYLNSNDMNYENTYQYFVKYFSQFKQSTLRKVFKKFGMNSYILGWNSNPYAVFALKFCDSLVMNKKSFINLFLLVAVSNNIELKYENK